ncbi:MAG: carboxypeptidase-like regulatory domain-containing protein [Flavobacteriaceae bacterium]
MKLKAPWLRSILLVSFLFNTVLGLSQSNSNLISGRIFDEGKPMYNVSITIADSDIVAVSDENGFYELRASPGETLVYSHLGMETVEVIVEDVTSIVNIAMEPRFEELDEVVVKKRKRSQKALAELYPKDKNLIKTGFGIINGEGMGFKVNVWEGKELSMAGIDFLTALQSKVPGMRIYRPPGDPTRPVAFLPRRFNSISNPAPALYELDGITYNEAPTWIDIANIERIAVINSPGALVRYGAAAAGGLIVINTKVGTFERNEQGEKIPYDQARLRDNIFRESELGSVDKVPIPRDIEILQKSETLEEALNYLKNKDLLSHPSAFYQMDVGRYFMQQWRARDYYLSVLKSIVKNYSQNAVILKSVAYSLEEIEEFDLALSVYKQILRLRPKYGQSYRDLAHIYLKNLDTVRSIELLTRYILYKDLKSKPVLDGIDSIIQTDFDNLLEGTNFIATDEDVNKAVNHGTRMVFEWNNGDAEFELQFVNPENRYYNWKHIYKDNAEQIKKEKLEGYSSEQFFIDDTMPGKWQINLKYIGNKTFDPTYLKSTIYYNYGTPFEKSETQLFRITQKKVNSNLFTLINTPIAVAGKP